MIRLVTCFLILGLLTACRKDHPSLVRKRESEYQLLALTWLSEQRNYSAEKSDVVSRFINSQSGAYTDTIAVHVPNVSIASTGEKGLALVLKSKASDQYFIATFFPTDIEKWAPVTRNQADRLLASGVIDDETAKALVDVSEAIRHQK